MEEYEQQYALDRKEENDMEFDNVEDIYAFNTNQVYNDENCQCSIWISLIWN